MAPRRLFLIPVLLLLTASLAACGGSESSPSGDATSQSGSATAEQTASGSSSSAAGDVDQTVTLHPKGNQMKYKETDFTVAPGQTVKLVFENTATSPSMRHNVVILAKAPSDQVFQKVGEAGAQAGASSDYVPSGMEDMILAHTPMSKPGETVSVTFTAPEETGDHGYVCTYPGHWALMQGTMHVKASSA